MPCPLKTVNADDGKLWTLGLWALNSSPLLSHLCRACQCSKVLIIEFVLIQSWIYSLVFFFFLRYSFDYIFVCSCVSLWVVPAGRGQSLSDVV